MFKIIFFCNIEFYNDLNLELKLWVDNIEMKWYRYIMKFKILFKYGCFSFIFFVNDIVVCKSKFVDELLLMILEGLFIYFDRWSYFKN